MKGKIPRTEKRESKGRGKKPAEPEKARKAQNDRIPLSFSDLQIPVRPLLDAAQERRAGTIIQANLKRLAVFLPFHVGGYRRFLVRMDELVVNGGLMFTWMSLRDQMAEDYQTADKALEESEALAAKNPKPGSKAAEKAWGRFEKGVEILSTYPLDPETAFNWAKEALQKPLGSDGVAGLEKSARIERIVRRLLGRLSAARDDLVLPNLRLVLKEVFRYHPVGMRRSDLFQEGVLGLHKALFRFDPTRGCRFSTYATYWIRQSIRKSLIDKSRMIRVPQGVQEDLRKEDCRFSDDEAARIRRILSDTVLFSAAEKDDDGGRNLFVVKDTNEHAQSEHLHTNTIPKTIFKALDRLEGREREVIARRFGLHGEKPQTLEQIGTRMNLSRERIRQIQKEALGHMKQIPGLQEVYEDLGKASFNGYTSNN